MLIVVDTEWGTLVKGHGRRELIIRVKLRNKNSGCSVRETPIDTVSPNQRGGEDRGRTFVPRLLQSKDSVVRHLV